MKTYDVFSILTLLISIVPVLHLKGSNCCKELELYVHLTQKISLLVLTLDLLEATDYAFVTNVTIQSVYNHGLH